MDALDTLLSRRSVLAAKQVEPGPDDEQLRLILTAGLRVPDHGKLAPWRIQILRKPAQAALGDLLAEEFVRANPNARDRLIELERQRLQRAPILLVVTSTPNLDCPIPVLEQRLSAGALCMNMLNAAHAQGFAAQWLTEWPAYNEAVKARLGHGPDDQIVGFIYLGSAAEPPAERKRPEIEDVASEWTP
ncbi:MAG: nitroreductase [Alphaproteobacteria bacterium]|nr:nitroreductase [Alphaproteobacteria bacterium]